jgi:hypothetical protein
MRQRVLAHSWSGPKSSHCTTYSNLYVLRSHDVLPLVLVTSRLRQDFTIHGQIVGRCSNPCSTVDPTSPTRLMHQPQALCTPPQLCVSTHVHNHHTLDCIVSSLTLLERPAPNTHRSTIPAVYAKAGMRDWPMTVRPMRALKASISWIR